MEKKPSLDQLLVEMSEILKIIQNQEGPISQNLTPEVVVNLEILESAIPIFSQYQQETFKEANIDIEHLVKDTLESSNTDPRTRQLLKRAKDIEKDARILQLAYSKAIERGKGRKQVKRSTDTNKQQLKERRKLFKPLGGDKNWIPL
jgi:hypothetical protein